MKLTTIRNRLKRKISISGGFGLLQMVSEADTERCVSEDVGPQEGGFLDPTSIGEGNRAFLVRV